MKAPGKIQITVWLLGLAGAALFTILLIRQGGPRVGAAFASAGWPIAAVVAYHFEVPVFLDALAWWVLFPKSDRLPLRKLLWMRWIGESVSTLVPSAAVGGDVVRARLAAINGAPLSVAAGAPPGGPFLRGFSPPALFLSVGVGFFWGTRAEKILESQETKL